MTSYVTADYKNSLKHALYINQVIICLPTIAY